MIDMCPTIWVEDYRITIPFRVSRHFSTISYAQTEWDPHINAILPTL